MRSYPRLNFQPHDCKNVRLPIFLWEPLNGTVIICLWVLTDCNRRDFFKRLASETGGIVLPMLFIGPDPYDTTIDGRDYYGMDCGRLFSDQCTYEIQQLKGSVYWVPDSTFDLMMNGMMKQLSRAGFKIVVAHGHGPSTNYIGSHASGIQGQV